MVAALLSLGAAGVVGAVFAAWGVVAVFEILMSGLDHRRAVSAQRARDAEPPPDAAAPDAPVVAIVAEPGEAPPPVGDPEDVPQADEPRAPEPTVEPEGAPATADLTTGGENGEHAVAAAPDADVAPARDEPDLGAAAGEAAPPASEESDWPPSSIARGPFDPVVGAPDAGPLPVPPPLAVPRPPSDDPEEDAR